MRVPDETKPNLCARRLTMIAESPFIIDVC